MIDVAFVRRIIRTATAVAGDDDNLPLREAIRLATDEQRLQVYALNLYGHLAHSEKVDLAELLADTRTAFKGKDLTGVLLNRAGFLPDNLQTALERLNLVPNAQG